MPAAAGQAQANNSHQSAAPFAQGRRPTTACALTASAAAACGCHTEYSIPQAVRSCSSRCKLSSNPAAIQQQQRRRLPPGAGVARIAPLQVPKAHGSSPGTCSSARRSAIPAAAAEIRAGISVLWLIDGWVLQERNGEEDTVSRFLSRPGRRRHPPPRETGRTCQVAAICSGL